MKIDIIISRICQSHLKMVKNEQIGWIEKWQSKYLVNSERRPCDFDNLKAGYRSDTAINLYNNEKRITQLYYIREQMGTKNSVYLCEGWPPEYSLIKQLLPNNDIYVVHEELTWTLSVTHEDDWIDGPIFTK